MKRYSALLILLVLLFGACDTQTQSLGEAHQLIVTDGVKEVNYSVADLQELAANEAMFNEVSYVGITLKTLLENAGFTSDDLKAVKAVASDGFSANYDSVIFLRDDVIVAYAKTDGPLSKDEGVFRMVVPGETGKLNVRMLVTLQVIP